MSDDASDLVAVRALLGRDPKGPFRVVVRDADGAPVVIRNGPLLDDGTPMPTRYWLIGAAEVRAVGRLESAGGVRDAERAVDAELLADAHRRYAAERDAEVPDEAEHRPRGGVGGTRQGVKCLHAHYAFHLAGGDDPVGRWVAEHLAGRLDVEIGDVSTLLSHAGHDRRIPVGPLAMLAEHLCHPDPDPPQPAQLTNALGAVADHVDDVVRERPELIDAHDVRIRGEHAWHFAIVEHGAAPETSEIEIGREDAEDVFRTLATESRRDRLHNPGLDPARVDSIVATACEIVGLMRRLHLERVRVVGAQSSTSTAGC